MGFSAPKPDPKLQAQQDAAAAQAKQQKITTLQGQLSDETQLRTRLYGFKPDPRFANFGTPPQGQDPGVTAGLRSLFGAMFTGQMR